MGCEYTCSAALCAISLTLCPESQAGAAGFIPYIGTSLSTIYLARQVSLATEAGSTPSVPLRSFELFELKILVTLFAENSTIDLDTALALLHHVELVYGLVHPEIC